MEKSEKIKFLNSLADEWDRFKNRNKYYSKNLELFLTTIITKNKKVLEIGCATGNLLNALEPSKGLGIDTSPSMIRIAKRKYKNLGFKVMDAENLKVNEKFDYVILSDLIGYLSDVWQAFRELNKVCNDKTRVVVTYYNYFWQPILKVAEILKLKIPTKEQNWLFLTDIENLLYLNNFRVIKSGYRMLIPIYIPLISNFFNKYIARMPIIRHFCLVQYIIAKKIQSPESEEFGVTIVIPCKNERGNIEDCIKKMPKFGKHQEILFVDGNSTDGTVDEIKKMMKNYKNKDIKLLHQGKGKGKGDAVRKGFLKASGDILMILDADLTVPPEDLPKFYLALKEGKAEFVNGSRLVYPIEKEAMRYINLFGNWIFSKAFTWIIEQRIRDTLCGTKALFKKEYMVLKEFKEFRNLDPFGDFELLFGASKINLSIVDIPIKYKERKYGATKIRRFYHGWLLAKMVLLGMRKLKFS